VVEFNEEGPEWHSGLPYNFQVRDREIVTLTPRTTVAFPHTQSMATAKHVHRLWPIGRRDERRCALEQLALLCVAGIAAFGSAAGPFVILLLLAVLLRLLDGWRWVQRFRSSPSPKSLANFVGIRGNSFFGEATMKRLYLFILGLCFSLYADLYAQNARCRGRIYSLQRVGRSATQSRWSTRGLSVATVNLADNKSLTNIWLAAPMAKPTQRLTSSTK